MDTLPWNLVLHFISKETTECLEMVNFFSMSQLTAKNSNQFAVKRKIERAAKPKKKKKRKEMLRTPRRTSKSRSFSHSPKSLSSVLGGTKIGSRKQKKKKETHHLIGHDFRLWSITYTSLK